MKSYLKMALAVTIAMWFCPDKADACTRVLYHSDSTGVTVTGRTLDWVQDIPTNLSLMPRGEKRAGYDTPDAISWTARYGSVVAVGYDMGVSEGMNEKGLVCNLLYLPGTSYTYKGDTRKKMSTSIWAQYVLDNFATVDEAISELSKDVFYIDAPAMPDGKSTTLHMAISDPSGASAIIEYVNGVLHIYSGAQYKVLTNAPTYPQQLAITDYWNGVGGLNMLPGTNRSADRFARSSFYVNALPDNLDLRHAIAGTLSVIRNASVPLGIGTHDHPEISSTRWRSLGDQTGMRYYFELTINPSVMWVDLGKVDFSKGTHKLILANNEMYAGEVNGKFVPTKPFHFFYHL